MDQINVQEIASADVVDTVTAESQAVMAAEWKIRLLNDWEMVMAGGGEGVPCWA